MIALAKPDNIIAMPTKSNEWYTPSRYVDAAREVMGGIDLDPASCAEANQTVRATRYYTQEDNGLVQPWYGRIWLNPPFSQSGRGSHGLFKSNLEIFAKRLVEEYQAGNVTQAILLAIPSPERAWFHPFWQYPICFADHPVKFYGQKKDPKNSLKHKLGTIFVYLGPNEQKFIDIFSQFGTIAKRISPPRQQPINLSLWEVQE